MSNKDLSITSPFSPLMDLAETYQREVNLDIVREGSRGTHYVIHIGEPGEVLSLTDRTAITEFGPNARLLRSIHTQARGTVVPSEADLVAGMMNTSGGEILAREGGNVVYFHHNQIESARLLRAGILSGAIRPDTLAPTTQLFMEDILRMPWDRIIKP